MAYPLDSFKNMKYIHLIIFLLISVCAVSQTPYQTPYAKYGSPNTAIRSGGGFFGDSTVVLPTYSDTFAANRSKTSLYAGAIIRVNNDYYFRNSTATGWILFSSGGSSNCPPNGLISPPSAVTWSGVGLVFDALSLRYNFGCRLYVSSATTLTLSPANPSFPRIDVIYCDTTSNVGVITGTPSAAPVKPIVDPLSQLEVTYVFVPAGATTPGGQSITVIYQSGVEWSLNTNISGANATYATNPYIAPVSALFPAAPNGSIYSWTDGSTHTLADNPYTKFWLRLNGVLTSDPEAFLTISYFNSATQISTEFQLANGTYGFDADSINGWQLIVLPNYLLGYTSPGTFDKINFIVNGAPSSSFQIDYVYLLSGAVTPPVISNAWQLTGNANTNEATDYTGTSDAKRWNWGTNNQIRAYMDTMGFDFADGDTTKRVLKWDQSTKKLWWDYTPVLLADRGIKVVSPNTLRLVDTSDGAGKKFMWVYDKAAFRVGEAASTEWDIGNIGTYSFAAGYLSTASGSRSFAFGEGSTATSTGAVALGFGTQATTGANSIALGYQAVSTGLRSLALLQGNASNTLAIAMGSGATASGQQSIAMGGNIASGQQSGGFGASSRAIGNSSTTFGLGTWSKSYGGTVVGLWNDTTDAVSQTATDPLNRAFQVGNGTLNTARSNALTILGNGNSGFGVLVPTAVTHLKAGTATAGTAPLKFTTGSLLTTPEIGAVQMQNGLWFLDSSNSVRDTIATRRWARNNIASQWTTTGSDIYYNTGNVGIGVLLPTEKLHVVGNALIDGGFTTDGSGDVNIKGGTVYLNSNINAAIGDPEGIGDGGYFKVESVNARAILDNTAHTLFFGINKAVPTEALDVVGNGKFTGKVIAPNVIGLTAVEQIVSFNAIAGTSYPLGSAESGGSTITFPSPAEGDVIYLFNYNNQAGIDVWSTDVALRLPNETSTFILQNNTNYVIQYADARWRIVSMFNSVTNSGTYTPTLTSTSNVAVSTAYACQYMRVGNTVTVSGKVSIDATLTATSTQLRVSLPIASALTQEYELGGTGYCPTVAGQGFSVLADATNDEALIKFIVTDINNDDYFFSFTYQIL